jgi:hypothetical protein
VSLPTRRRATAERLAAIEARLAGASPERVHEAFESALEGATEPRTAIPRRVWLRLYAHHVAAALAPEPARRFRGWCGLHYALAAGERPDAERLLTGCEEPWAWLEAARAAWAADEAERAARWLVVACLRAEDGIPPDPPRIEPSRVAALNPPADTVPRLPDAVADLWTEAERLELPGPASPWVPALLVIDGLLPPSLLGWAADLAGSGFDPDGPTPADEGPARQFLRALLQARAARSAAQPAGPGGYGEAELAARRRMKRLAPALLARYLDRLGGARRGP